MKPFKIKNVKLSPIKPGDYAGIPQVIKGKAQFMSLPKMRHSLRVQASKVIFHDDLGQTIKNQKP